MSDQNFWEFVPHEIVSCMGGKTGWNQWTSFARANNINPNQEPKCLGSGNEGVVFDLNDGRVMKLSHNLYEHSFATIVKQNPNKNIVAVHATELFDQTVVSVYDKLFPLAEKDEKHLKLLEHETLDRPLKPKLLEKFAQTKYHTDNKSDEHYRKCFLFYHNLSKYLVNYGLEIFDVHTKNILQKDDCLKLCDLGC